MGLELLIPISLVMPLLALALHGSSLKHSSGTPGRELLALTVAVLAYIILWVVIDAALGLVLGSVAAIVGATLIASLLAIPILRLGYLLLGLKPA